MKIEWNGGTLTKKRALFLCWKLWEWVAKNITQESMNTIKRGDSPANEVFKKGWFRHYGIAMINECPCCEHSHEDCARCLLKVIWPWPETDEDVPCIHSKSPFQLFHTARTVITAKKYAGIIRDAAKAEYEKLLKETNQ